MPIRLQPLQHRRRQRGLASSEAFVRGTGGLLAQCQKLVPDLVERSSDQVDFVVVEVVQTKLQSHKGFIVQTFGDRADSLCIGNAAIVASSAPWKALLSVGNLVLIHREQVQI